MNYSYTKRNTNKHSNGSTDRYCHTDSHTNSNWDADANSDSDSDANRNSDSHCDLMSQQYISLPSRGNRKRRLHRDDCCLFEHCAREFMSEDADESRVYVLFNNNKQVLR